MSSTVTVQIRKADVSEAHAIAKVHVASWRAAYKGLIPDETLAGLSVEGRAKSWQAILTDPTNPNRTMVALREGTIVGFGSFGPSRVKPTLGEVLALYAEPESWGTGAGRALLEDGRAMLEEGGFSTVMLWVLEGNARAIRFYERAGFQLNGEAKTENGLVHLYMTSRHGS
jgi:ribosomal protein S18 acetylase RimI-like enzyme